MKLLPHQEIGRDFLVSHKRSLLADGMRVGKSIQSIAACDEISASAPDDVVIGTVGYQSKINVLVICPASIRVQWRRQFDQFQRRTVNLTVISYEEAAKRPGAYGVGGMYMRTKPWDVLILDESHYLKNRKARRTDAVFNIIVPNAKRVWCLTGTPSPNNASELWPMLNKLFPETIARDDGKPMNYWQFVKKFCVVRTTPFGEKIEGNRNSDELKSRMAPIMLRRPSSIMGDTWLPDEMLYLDASKAELERLRNDLRRELTPELYTALCSDKYAEILEHRVEAQLKARMSRITGLAKVPALVERLKDDFDSGLDKVVLFAWHTDVIERLVGHLENAGHGYVVVHGGTSARQRQLNIDAFQRDGKYRAFIGNIKAAGVGLDLSAACETIFVERAWTPGDNDQAAMRIRGLNQKRASRVRYAVLPGSLDERLMAVNARKSEDIQELFG